MKAGVDREEKRAGSNQSTMYFNAESKVMALAWRALRPVRSENSAIMPSDQIIVQCRLAASCSAGVSRILAALRYSFAWVVGPRRRHMLGTLRSESRKVVERGEFR